MTLRDEVQRRFTKDVESHEMTILRDDGVYRHIRFQRPESSVYRFDIITWPGYLCYTGDMGTYVFSRIHDMFDFFVEDNKHGVRINPPYWAEKLQSVDRIDGIEKFNPQAVIDYIEDKYKSFQEGYDEVERVEIQTSLNEELCDLCEGVRNGDISEEMTYTHLSRIQYGRYHVFDDYWETSFKEYSYRYLWCCYAIVWGIQLYTSHKTRGNV